MIGFTHKDDETQAATSSAHLVLFCFFFPCFVDLAQRQWLIDCEWSVEKGNCCNCPAILTTTARRYLRSADSRSAELVCFQSRINNRLVTIIQFITEREVVYELTSL